jgi:hypothetical protein
MAPRVAAEAAAFGAADAVETLKARLALGIGGTGRARLLQTPAWDVTIFVRIADNTTRSAVIRVLVLRADIVAAEVVFTLAVLAAALTFVQFAPVVRAGLIVGAAGAIAAVSIGAGLIAFAIRPSRAAHAILTGNVITINDTAIGIAATRAARIVATDVVAIDIDAAVDEVGRTAGVDSRTGRLQCAALDRTSPGRCVTRCPLTTADIVAARKGREAAEVAANIVPVLTGDAARSA